MVNIFGEAVLRTLISRELTALVTPPEREREREKRAPASMNGGESVRVCVFVSSISTLRRARIVRRFVRDVDLSTRRFVYPSNGKGGDGLLYTASVQPVIGQLDWLHGFPGLFTDTSVPIRFYFLVLFSHFSVFGSVLSIKLPYVSFWAHLKYRLVSIVSYRSWRGDLNSNGQLAEHLSWNRIQLKP